MPSKHGDFTDTSKFSKGDIPKSSSASTLNSDKPGTKHAKFMEDAYHENMRIEREHSSDTSCLPLRQLFSRGPARREYLQSYIEKHLSDGDLNADNLIGLWHRETTDKDIKDRKIGKKDIYRNILDYSTMQLKTIEKMGLMPSPKTDDAKKDLDDAKEDLKELLWHVGTLERAAKTAPDDPKAAIKTVVGVVQQLHELTRILIDKKTLPDSPRIKAREERKRATGEYLQKYIKEHVTKGDINHGSLLQLCKTNEDLRICEKDIVDNILSYGQEQLATLVKQGKEALKGTPAAEGLILGMSLLDHAEQTASHNPEAAVKDVVMVVQAQHKLLEQLVQNEALKSPQYGEKPGSMPPKNWQPSNDLSSQRQQPSSEMLRDNGSNTENVTTISRQTHDLSDGKYNPTL